jgi:two-component system, OmpR family, KDP operon response regulator KdpE
VPRRSRKPPLRIAPQAPPQHRRVLIVERDDDNRESLGMLLEARGHDVHLASTGEQAIALAATRRPDIVLLDLGLADMDGEQAIAAIKVSPSAPPFVVAYTGFPNRERRARAAGCDAFILKPSLDLIIAVIEAFDRSSALRSGVLH